MVLGFAPAITGVHALQAQVVAHVLDVTGQWRLDGSSATVVSGEGLAAGARLTAVSNRMGDAITIVRDEDMSRQWIACNTSATNPCRNSTVIPGGSTVAPQGQIRGLVNAALSVLLSKPPAVGAHYALTLTRGMVPPPEVEAVVPLDPAQGIVLPPAAEDLAAGAYTISIGRAGEKTAATELAGQLTSDGTWRPLPWNSTGLFYVTMKNALGERASGTMLLVTPADDYPAIQNRFDAMKTRASAWTGPHARADEQLFLRAFLVSQSQSGNSQP